MGNGCLAVFDLELYSSALAFIAVGRGGREITRQYLPNHSFSGRGRKGKQSSNIMAIFADRDEAGV